MDASVNMKMTPDEHRLIRESVENHIERVEAVSLDKDLHPRERQEARDKFASLGRLLAKL